MKPESCPSKSKDQLIVSGVVVSGARKAAFFTQLPWVQAQCLDRLGFRPFPGTLNLQILEPDRSAAARVLDLPGQPLVSPEADFCAGRVYPVSMGAIPAAIVRPEESVRIHDDGVIEILAPVCLREELKLKDGDVVGLTVTL